MCEMKNGEKSRLSPGFMARLVGECSILNIHEHNVEHRLQTHIVLGAGEKFLDKTIESLLCGSLHFSNMLRCSDGNVGQLSLACWRKTSAKGCHLKDPSFKCQVHFT